MVTACNGVFRIFRLSHCYSYTECIFLQLRDTWSRPILGPPPCPIATLQAETTIPSDIEQ